MLNKEKPSYSRYTFLVLPDAPKSGEVYDAQNEGITVVIAVDRVTAERQIMPRRGQRVIFLGCTESVVLQQFSRFGHSFTRSVDLEPMIRKVLVHEVDSEYALLNEPSAASAQHFRRFSAEQRIAELNRWAEHFDYPKNWYVDSDWHENRSK